MAAEEAMYVFQVSNFRPIWNDKGSGGRHDGAFYRPIPDPGSYIVGDYGQSNYNYPAPNRSVLSFKPIKDDVLRRPVRFEFVWKDRGSGANEDGSFWRPIPPTGYKALGLVCQRGYNPPALDTVMCIKDKYLVPGELQSRVWDDTSTGSDVDFGCWDILTRNERGMICNTFAGTTSHNIPNYCPEAHCVNQSYVATFNPEMEAAKSTNFSYHKERINFDRKQFPLHYHQIFGNRWQHLQDMIRIPDDAEGNRCFMGTFSQNASGSEGGMVFMAKTSPNSSRGEVVWMHELNNKSLAGGFNHPGDLRRVGHIVVTAGQNWNSPANNIPFADKMNRGNGGQAILFYDVNHSLPVYAGRLSNFLHNGKWVSLDTDIDTITVTKHDNYYYLAFNGIGSTGGLVCRAKYLSPSAVWTSVQTGNLGSKNPVKLENEALMAVQEESGHVSYSRFLGAFSRRSAAPLPGTAFGSGTTFSLSTLRNGKSYVVYANVESDGDIEIEQIESA